MYRRCPVTTALAVSEERGKNYVNTNDLIQINSMVVINASQKKGTAQKSIQEEWKTILPHKKRI